MSISDKVLVVDDKQMMRDSVTCTLQRAGFTVITAADGAAAIKATARHRPAAVITDLKMPEMDGLELLKRLIEADDQLPVVLMTAHGNVQTAVEAMKRGAFDFIQKPFEGDQLVVVMERAAKHRKLMAENAMLKAAAGQEQEVGTLLIGRSRVMRQVAAQIRQIAPSHATVLINGESGVGKEVVARAIHQHSLRRDQPMLCVNCAALSGGLLESELFGHEKGAFTGADQMRKGRFELADGGTLLLDEVTEIGPELQAKLLRVLQEGEFERVGSSVTQRVDVRVIATTNRRLQDAVARGEFRQDLFYRLNVLPIPLPPLRERPEDIAMLSEHFLERISRREGGSPRSFTDEAMKLLQQYAWPGNVRELRNICERAAVLAPRREIGAEMLEPWLMSPSEQIPQLAQASHAAPPITPTVIIERQTALGALPVRPLEEVERDQIVRTLDHFHGNRARTARALGIGVRTLGLKLKKWKAEDLIPQSA